MVDFFNHPAIDRGSMEELTAKYPDSYLYLLSNEEQEVWYIIAKSEVSRDDVRAQAYALIGSPGQSQVRYAFTIQEGVNLQKPWEGINFQEELRR